MTDPVPALEDPFRGTPYRLHERLHRKHMTEIHKVDGPAGCCLAKILRPEFIYGDKIKRMLVRLWHTSFRGQHGRPSLCFKSSLDLVRTGP